MNLFRMTSYNVAPFIDLLDDYLTERIRVTNLTACADTLRNELDQLITDIQQSSDRLRECNRTP